MAGGGDSVMAEGEDAFSSTPNRRRKAERLDLEAGASGILRGAGGIANWSPIALTSRLTECSVVFEICVMSR